MDEQTRKDVDEACLRLMGHEDLRWLDGSGGWWWAPTFGDQIRAPMSPSRQPALVVPLAEALHDRGFLVRMFQTTTEGERWSVSIVGKDDFGFLVAEESGDTLPECLAKAAARAVGTETKE